MGEVYKARDTRLKAMSPSRALPDTFATDPERLSTASASPIGSATRQWPASRPMNVFSAYTSAEGDQNQIYLTTFPKPTTRSRVSINGGEDPQWRRDGRELLYIAGQQTLMAVRVRPDGTFEDAEPLSERLSIHSPWRSVRPIHLQTGSDFSSASAPTTATRCWL